MIKQKICSTRMVLISRFVCSSAAFRQGARRRSIENLKNLVKKGLFSGKLMILNLFHRVRRRFSPSEAIIPTEWYEKTGKLEFRGKTIPFGSWILCAVTGQTGPSLKWLFSLRTAAIKQISASLHDLYTFRSNLV